MLEKEMKKWHHQSWRWGWHKQQRREINSSFLLQWLSTTLKPNFLELEEERRKAELWHHFLSSTDASSFWWETLEPRKVPDQQSSYMTITYCFRQRMITAIFFFFFGHKIKSTLSSSFGDKVRGIHYYYQIAFALNVIQKLANFFLDQFRKERHLVYYLLLISLEFRKFPPFFSWFRTILRHVLGYDTHEGKALKPPNYYLLGEQSPHNMVLLGLRKATQS